jgi:tetratricopeptide (TPR) repeat protein
VTNPGFTVRFFGPERARQPEPFVLRRPKGGDTIRIFVFGESAAFGDPAPEFGMPRMLQALLELRFPGTRFEVVNAAITGINSHAILPIAKACADAEGDLWVVYMGNNEVVGPFGAGTVFGPQAPPLPLIRGSLAVKSTRLGQGLDAVVRRFQPIPADKREWGGMLMFVENRVPARDPRMDAVYHHFEQNLEDILELARRRGVPVVLSTVAVNLQGCTPFASAHRDGLSASQQAAWQELFARGVQALTASDPAEAMAQFRRAAGVDGSVAELQHMMGNALLALGDPASARAAYAKARDLDTLRFRCDSVLNETIRRVAARRGGTGVGLVDAELLFEGLNRAGFSETDLFYDHVHLAFPANYELAAALAQEILPRLPPAVRAAGATEWAPPEACAERLAWTAYDEAQAITQMLARYQDPPFTFQSDYRMRLQRMRNRLLALRGQRVSGAAAAADACRRALEQAPDDIVLWQRLSKILHALKTLPEAESAAQRVTEALPHSKAGWIRLGRIRTDQGDTAGALQAMDRALAIDPSDELALLHRGAALAKAGRTEEAELALHRSIEVNPRMGPAYLALYGLQKAAGRTADAEASLRLALANRVMMAEDLAMLAGACLQQKWYPEALTNLVAAIELDPANPAYLLQTGNLLDSMERREEARGYYQQAVTVAPRLGEAQYLLGVSYGRAGDAASALLHFEQAVEYLPDIPEAHMNLAIAQMQTGRREDAIQSLREVLRLQPAHPQAQEHLQALLEQP